MNVRKAECNRCISNTDWLVMGRRKETLKTNGWLKILRWGRVHVITGDKMMAGMKNVLSMTLFQTAEKLWPTFNSGF